MTVTDFPNQTDFRADLDRNEKGILRHHIANTMTMMRNDPDWLGVLAYDEFRQEVILLKPIPRHDGYVETNFKPRPITDTDITAAHEWFCLDNFPNVPRENIIHALQAAAKENSFHPVRDYRRCQHIFHSRPILIPTESKSEPSAGAVAVVGLLAGGLADWRGFFGEVSTQFTRRGFAGLETSRLGALTVVGSDFPARVDDARGTRILLFSRRAPDFAGYGRRGTAKLTTRHAETPAKSISTARKPCRVCLKYSGYHIRHTQ